MTNKIKMPGRSSHTICAARFLLKIIPFAQPGQNSIQPVTLPPSAGIKDNLLTGRPSNQQLTSQPFNHSTIQPFNYSTIQPFNYSTIQPFHMPQKPFYITVFVFTEQI
jgi:hypothetical protein